MVPLEQTAMEAQLEGYLQPRPKVPFHPLTLICLSPISTTALLCLSAL